ncbi:hypothetical protein TNCV_4561711 [Trichonephila clavipes]|nr:hypothetical protein TNCV_4561711 [Trichonephila clavipes]
MILDFAPYLPNESINFTFVWRVSGSILQSLRNLFLALISSLMFSGRRRCGVFINLLEVEAEIAFENIAGKTLVTEILKFLRIRMMCCLKVSLLSRYLVFLDQGMCVYTGEGISELGPRRHKETHQQCVLFAPDPTAPGNDSARVLHEGSSQSKQPPEREPYLLSNRTAKLILSREKSMLMIDAMVTRNASKIFPFEKEREAGLNATSGFSTENADPVFPTQGDGTVPTIEVPAFVEKKKNRRGDSSIKELRF